MKKDKAMNEQVTPTGIDFVMYLVKDFKRARAFYEGVFELKPGADHDGFVEYDLADGNTFAIAVAPEGAHIQCGGAMFGVPDAQAAVDRIKALGGTFFATYGGDKCTSGWCADPEGNPFGVHQRK
jgi:predicted enzyme related to lactoylglutathione lyase